MLVYSLLQCLTSVLSDAPPLPATTPMNVVQTPVPRDDEDFDIQMMLEESLANDTRSSPGMEVLAENAIDLLWYQKCRVSILEVRLVLFCWSC